MTKIKSNTGWGIISFFLSIPVLLWFIAPKQNPPFGSISMASASFGEIFGLVGIVMFAINLILATRAHFIERLFNGLNTVYQKHNILGQLAFILLLFHPLFLIPRYASNAAAAGSFLFLSGNWARNWGILALGMMIALITLTLYLRPRYNIWKTTHKLLGFAFFLGALHVYLIPSYVMNNIPLKGYVLGFAVLGIIAFLYKTVFGRFLIKRYQYIVENINKPNADIAEISLKPLRGKMTFKPGQFIFISFYQNGLTSESHPFSISSSPHEKYLKITVKNLGDFTYDLLDKLRVGTKAVIEGPFGVFSYQNAPRKSQIWIAGGIGITPFVSMAKSILESRKDYNIYLFYSVKKEWEAVYLGLLKEVELRLNGRLKVIPYYSAKNGHMRGAYILGVIDTIKDYDIFICAPPAMIHALKKDLAQKGVRRENIHSEEFNF